jgi:predicted glycosyltransferase
MRVLFDVTHPAHVHLFRYPIKHLQSKGHDIKVTSREKDLTTDLLNAYNIDHSPISTKGDSTVSLVTEWIAREARMIKTAYSFDPDVIVSRLNPPAAHASTVVRCPSIVFDDSEVVRLAGRITHPFADIVCTPANFDLDLGNKQERYDGFHELAYLRPNQFEPKKEVLEEFDIDVDSEYSVLRFVSWGAHHDVNEEGLSREAKEKLVSRLSDIGDVYITSESEIPSKFEEYRLPVPPKEIHHLLYFSNLYVGDSQTMATEAAVLGTPAIRTNTFAYDDDMSNFVKLEEDYGLLRSTTDEDEAIQLASEWFESAHLQTTFHHRRKNLLDDTEDVCTYILDRIREVGQ